MTQTVTPPQAGGVQTSERSHSNAIVFVLAFAGITAAIMQTLVVPLLREFPTLLHTDASTASWIVTATLLTAAVATPVSGRLGDLYGKRPVMIGCAVLLVIGSLVTALATDVGTMIVGRGLQGAAMGIVPLGISAMRDLLPPEKLGSSIALMSASMGIGGALGLPISAGVAEYANWRAIFWMALVLAVIVAVLIIAFVPATPVTGTGSFDVAGAIGLGAGLVALLLGVSKGGDWGWGSATTLSLLIGSVVVFVLWGLMELRMKSPLVDLRVTARPVVLLTNVASLVVGFSMYAQTLLYPQMLQLPEAFGGLGQNMFQMGLWMAPGGFMMMLMSPVGAALSAAKGPRITLAAGAAIMGLGYVTSLFAMGSTWGVMVAGMIICTGTGFAYGAMPALIMGSVPVSETASANSFNTLMRSVGTSIAAAVVGVILAQMTTSFQTAGGGVLEVTSESGFKVGLVIGAVVAVVAAVLALAIPDRRKAVTSRRV